MIRADVKRIGRKYILSVRDHANDRLVCAAASTVGLTLANVLRIMEREGELRRAHFRATCGDMLLEVEPYEEYDEETLHCYYMAAVGFSMLAKKYPEEIRFDDHLA